MPYRASSSRLRRLSEEAVGRPAVLLSLSSGFAFVRLEDTAEDCFVPGKALRGALPGDRVLVHVDEGDKRGPSGRILKILEGGDHLFTGKLIQDQDKSFQVMADRSIRYPLPVKRSSVGSACPGDKVRFLVRLDKQERALAELLTVYGSADSARVCADSLIDSMGIPCVFSEEVQREAKESAARRDSLEGREDFRDRLIFTIDGEDAKDLDDAVSVVKDGENYILGVHIADVTNYVQENSALDREALKRGTSVYLADRVIPMLPHTLSNGICSLNAGEDRLALSCIMTVDPKGMVIDHEIAETVIHVDRRMSYTSLAEMQEYEELVPMFQRMLELSKILRARGKQRGSIDFDFPETKMILDENGHPIDIKPYDRNVATKIIEDFMLLANETVAEDYYWQEIPFVYRVHEAPDDEKIRALATFINNFGFSMHIGANEVRPKEIQKLLGKVEGTPQEALISRLALRSMKQARYTPENSGHFGLAANYYTHFTSPIRRYPDLQIHRIIKDNLRGRMNGERMEHYRKILEEVTKHASETERRADEAERETVKLKKVEYMSDRIGNVYTGVISSVTKWGMYVELPNTIEGLIHVANMRDDHYNYDESRYEMVGERTGKVYKLGQEVRVRVADTDRLMRTIDFVIAKERDEENGEDEW